MPLFDGRPHPNPSATVRIIIVSGRYSKALVKDAEREFNIAYNGRCEIKHVAYGEALGGYPADVILLVRDDRSDHHERMMAQEWVLRVLRLRLKPGGLWIEV